MTKQKDETDDLLGKDKSSAVVAPKSGSDLSPVNVAPGTEGIEAEDTTFPRFRLLQNTSAEVESGTDKAGLFKHSLSEETFEKIEIIPLSLIKTRVMFNPDDRKGAPVCRSGDTKHGSGCDCGCNNLCSACKFCKWEAGVPPVCSLVYNYPVLTTDEIGKTALPALVSFMKASAQAALKINTLVKSAIPPAPFWNQVWELSGVTKKFKKGSAFVINLKKIRDTSKEEREWCEKVYTHCIAGKSVEIDDVNES